MDLGALTLLPVLAADAQGLAQLVITVQLPVTLGGKAIVVDRQLGVAEFSTPSVATAPPF